MSTESEEAVEHAGSPIGARTARRSLWRNRDFMLFWGGESVSLVGTAVSYVALPLVGVIFLHANAFQMGVLATVEKLPPLVFGAFAGTLVDRCRRDRLMVATDLGRFALLGWIPLAAVLGVLDVWQLAGVAFLVGLLSLLFNVAYQAFLPSVVVDDQLGDGNGKLAASQSVAEVGGPGIAAWLIALGGAPVALLADAVSYVVSAVCVVSLRSKDTVARTRGRAGGFWEETRNGFMLLWRDDVLRLVTVAMTVTNFFSQMQMTLYFLFLVDGLGFGATMIGVLFSVSGVLGFFSSILCDRISARIGIGRLLAAGMAIEAVGAICLAAAAGPILLKAALILLGEAAFSVGMSLVGVGFVTLRQRRTVEASRGRVIGSSRFLTQGVLPIASLVAGGVAAQFGIRAALVVGAAGIAVGVCLLLQRKVLSLRFHAT